MPLRAQVVLGASVFLLLISPVAAAAGTASDSPPDTAPDRYLRCVVHIGSPAIRTIEKDGRRFEVFLRDPDTHRMSPDLRPVGGTGFLVREGESIFLVTARHVGRQAKRATRLIMYREEQTPLRCQLGHVVPPEGDLPWLHHDSADVSVLPLSPPDEELRSRLHGRALDLAELAATPEAPPRGAVVEAIGFPMGIGLGPRSCPLSRYSRVAGPLMPVSTPEGSIEALVTDRATAGGMSGGPVFSPPPHDPGGNPAGKPRCMGLVSGTMSDQTGGKTGSIMPAMHIVGLIRKHLSK